MTVVCSKRVTGGGSGEHQGAKLGACDEYSNRCKDDGIHLTAVKREGRLRITLGRATGESGVKEARWSNVVQRRGKGWIAAFDVF